MKTSLVLQFSTLFSLQEGALWYSGKFWAVFFVLGLILLVIIILLFRLERKLSKIEKQIKE